MPWTVALLTVLLTGGFDEFRQVQVRIEGYLGATRQETQAWEELDVRVGEGPMRKFAMTDIKSLSGGPVLGADLLQQVEMIKPNFIFTGGDDLIQKIATAQPNQLLKITGYTQLGSQFVLVETVERSEPITGPTPTPSLREKLLGF
ncbi:MAG: hypothetical protein AB1689_13100 [Thermodesulfobacteriota bacterium]